MIGGLNVYVWFDLFHGTHLPNGMGSFSRMEWPDEGGFADQVAMVPSMMYEVMEFVIKENAD